MSNLSFARIMYGTNENPDTSRWMQGGPTPSRLTYSAAPANAPLENWLRKILHAVLPNHF